MTTTAGTPMPVLDVSAALQAAVAAAAEIARVGLSDSLAFGIPPPVEQPPAPAPTPVVAPAPVEHEPPSNPRVVLAPPPPQQQALALVAAPLYQQQLQQQQQQLQAASILVEARASVESPAASSSSSDQCTGQDAAGDQQQLLLQHQQHQQQHMDHGMVGATDGGEKTFEESEEDAAKRLARSRERNREHARRTRLRKKAQLEALQSKVRLLEAEKKALKLKIEECSIASILINLAEEEQQPKDETTSLLDATIQRQENQPDTDAKIHLLTAGKRKRFASVDTSEENKAPQTLKLQIDGQTKIIGPKSHINWKSGVYSDENGVQRQLTSEQLEGLRRERNRMHAKMTRDRKKNFIATIEKTIEELERDCQKMRDVLNKVGAQQQVLTAPVTPMTSPREISLPPLKTEAPAPTHTALVAPPVVALTAAPAALTAPTPTSSLLSAAVAMAPPKALAPVPALPAAAQENPAKRAKVAHGFSWTG